MFIKTLLLQTPTCISLHNVSANLFSRDCLKRRNQNNSKLKGGECQMYRSNWGAPGSLSCNRATQSSGPIVTPILCSVLRQSAQELRLPARAPLLWIHTHISSQTSPPLQGHIAVCGLRHDDTIKVKIRSLSTAMELFVRHVDTLSKKSWDTA